MQLNSDKICWFHVIWINIYNYELITQKIWDEKKPSNLFYIQYASVKFGEGNGNPLQYSCLEKPWRRRSLVGYNPWGREELDTTERLHFHFSFSCIGKGKGNLLQCSRLENPRDGGAWWAAVSGVPQSWTWLKGLSSSSKGHIQLVKWQSCFLNRIYFIPNLAVLTTALYCIMCNMLKIKMKENPFPY